MLIRHSHLFRTILRSYALRQRPIKYSKTPMLGDMHLLCGAADDHLGRYVLVNHLSGAHMFYWLSEVSVALKSIAWISRVHLNPSSLHIGTKWE